MVALGPRPGDCWAIGRLRPDLGSGVLLTRTLDGREKERFTLPLEEFIARVRRRRAAVAVLLPPARRARHPYGIGIATENEPGYLPWKGLTGTGFASYEDAQREAATINAEVFHLSPEEAFAIVASSMRFAIGQPEVDDGQA